MPPSDSAICKLGRVALPRPDALRAEDDFVFQQRPQSRDGVFRRPFDRRLADPQAGQLAQDALGRLTEGRDRPGQRDDLAGRRRQVAAADRQRRVPRHASHVTMGIVVVGSLQANLSHQTRHALVAPIDEPRRLSASASKAATAVPLFYSARWRRSPGPSPRCREPGRGLRTPSGRRVDGPLSRRSAGTTAECRPWRPIKTPTPAVRPRLLGPG